MIRTKLADRLLTLVETETGPIQPTVRAFLVVRFLEELDREVVHREEADARVAAAGGGR